MGRSKPRYSPVIDVPFIELMKQWQADAFTVETILVAELLIAAKAEVDIGGIDRIEGFIARAYMRAGIMPKLHVGYGLTLPF